MSQSLDGASGADPARARAEALIARYPDIAATDIAELRGWFAKQASALDIGLLASNEALAGNYRRFRAEHLDRFGLRDILLVAGVSVLLIGGVVAMAVTG